MINTNDKGALATMIYEIFDHAHMLAKQSPEAAKAFFHKQSSLPVIAGLLKINYDPSVKWRIPVGGTVPYKTDKDAPEGYAQTDLKQEYRRLSIFLENDQYTNLPRVKRESLWIQMCEGLHWKEADLINKIKDRNLVATYPLFTADFIRYAFPGLLPAEVGEPVVIEDEVTTPEQVKEIEISLEEAKEESNFVPDEVVQNHFESYGNSVEDKVKSFIESFDDKTVLVDFCKSVLTLVGNEVATEEPKKPVAAKPVEKKSKEQKPPRLKKDGTPWGKPTRPAK